MVLDVDGGLHVVAHDTGAAAAGRHRARIGIGQRDLLIGALKHPRRECLEALHLLPELRDLLSQPGDLGRERLGGLLKVGGVELLQVTRDARLDLGPPPRHLGAREVAVAVVHRLELAAVDRHAGGG